MRTRLSPGESLILYAFIVGFVFLFYLLGLFLGKEYFTPAESSTEKVVVSDTPLPDLRPELGFYQQLIAPSQSPQESSPSSGQDREAERGEPGTQLQERPHRQIIHTVQVAALSKEEDIGRILIRLEAKNYLGRVQPPEGRKDHYCRVLVGEFATLEEAQQMEDRLREDGFPTFIRKIVF